MPASLSVIEQVGRVGHVARRVLRIRGLPRQAARGRCVLTVATQLAELEAVRRPIAHLRLEEQARLLTAAVVRRRDSAAGGYMAGPAAKGPNCSIAGAAAFSSGYPVRLRNPTIKRTRKRMAVREWGERESQGVSGWSLVAREK